MNIKDALKPGLKSLPGDCIEWAGKRGGNKTTFVTWQGIRRPLRDWALSLGYSYGGFRYRLMTMPLENAMDGTFKKAKRSYIRKPKAKKERPAVINRGWVYCSPVEALI